MRALLCAAGVLLQASAAADELVVANKSDHTAVWVDLESLELRGPASTGRGPHEVAVSPDGKRLFVTNYGEAGLLRSEPGHTLSVLDADRAEPLATWELGSHTRPHGVWVSRDGSLLWVTTEGSGSVLELDAGSGEILRRFETGQEVSHMVVPSRDESLLFVTNIGSGTLTVIERASGATQTIATGEGCEGIDVSPDGREVWVANRSANTLSVVDVGLRRVVATLESGGRMPIRLKFRPDGEEVWVTHVLSRTVTIFDAGERERLAEIDVSLHALGLPGPVGLLFDPAGARAFVAHTSADQVAEIDVESRKLVRTFSPGDEPDGLGYLPR